MSEEKLKITFSPDKVESFYWKEQKISVIPYFSLTTKAAITREYLVNLFGDPAEDLSNRYFVAQYALAMQIVDYQTNIEIDGLDADGLFTSGLWSEILKHIPGYENLRKDLEQIVALNQHQLSIEKSVGTVLQTLSDKLTGVLDNLSQMDVDKLKEVSDQFSTKLEELNEKVPGITGSPAVVVSKRGKKKTQ